MAQSLYMQKCTIVTLFLFVFLSNGESQKFSRNLSPKSLDFKKQKLTHLHFYFHEIRVGDHPTAMEVARSAITDTSPTIFGSTVIIDDLLTAGPEPSSKILGRAQGIYASADLSHPALLMTMNFVFVEGKYNGSTLSILGRNTASSLVKEISVVGGSGLFRFARGYALAKIYSFSATQLGNAVIEFDVYVQHY